jgi:hypothetical protein
VSGDGQTVDAHGHRDLAVIGVDDEPVRGNF